METYHKINGLYKRYTSGPKKGKFIMGEWANEEIGYLANNDWEFTEKVDGTNIRIGLHRYEDDLRVEFGGRSDNAVLPKALLEWLKEKFPQSPRGSGANTKTGLWMLDNDLTDVVLFGEGYGPDIQGGGKYRDDQAFVLFDVKIGDWWLKRDDVDDIADKLGIESVPTIGHGTLQDAMDIVTSGLTWDSNGKITNWGHGVVRGGLKSQWGNFEAEGIVARPSVPLFTRRGDRVITKIKSRDFK